MCCGSWRARLRRTSLVTNTNEPGERHLRAVLFWASGSDERADFAPDPLGHDDAGHVRAELLVGGEAHGVAAEEAEELGVGFGAADEGIDAAGLGEEAALDLDGVAELAADLALPGGLVGAELAGVEAVGF